jgi:hypothetical protein
MTHHIKCPNCEHEFEVDIGAPCNIAITPCVKCGAPLVNHNNADVWSILSPADMEKIPPDMRDHFSKTVLDLMINKLEQIIGDPDPEITPFTRAKFFIPASETNSEGCVVLMKDNPTEWPEFNKVTNMAERLGFKMALFEVATRKFGQNIPSN